MIAEAAHSKCAAGTLRRAARSVARVYDARLAPVGLTTSQFSILRNLDSRSEPATLAVLAEELVFERTSLHRALEPLRREGFIAYGEGPGRAKQIRLTAKGARKVAQATPHWSAAQDEFVSRVGRAAWNTLAGELGEIVDVARAMSLTQE